MFVAGTRLSVLAAGTDPRTLGRYEVLKHLASGGMADVYLARSSGLEGFERYVVIKRIRAQEARDQTYVKLFLDEARLAAALHHHNIVQVHDVGHEGDEYFFAMEYVHGRDARELLKKAAGRTEHVPLEHVVTIITSAAAGLHHAHQLLGPDRKPLGLVHRDVSPSNILIGYDGSIKVADFGIAKAALRSSETRSGTLKGKVAYMSPEQCRGKAVDRRSDVFALGIVLYELVTARRLFKSDSDYMTMSAIIAGEIPLPTKFRADLPAGLEAIIAKALAIDPGDRYGTADELRRALEQWAIGAGLQMSTTSLGDYMTTLFGARVEPWLTDVPFSEQEEGGTDVDGSGSGIAASPELSLSGLEETVDPDAPIARARKKQITSVPLVTDTAPPFSSRPTGTSMAWSPDAPPELAPPHRRARILIGAGAAVLIAIGVFALIRRTGGTTAPDDRAPASVPVTTMAPRPAPAIDPRPQAPPTEVVPDAPTATAVAPVEPPVGNGSSSVPSIKMAPGPKKPTKPKPTRTKPTGTDPNPEWDPKALFPK